MGRRVMPPAQCAMSRETVFKGGHVMFVDVARGEKLIKNSSYYSGPCLYRGFESVPRYTGEFVGVSSIALVTIVVVGVAKL